MYLIILQGYKMFYLSQTLTKKNFVFVYNKDLKKNIFL